MLAIYISYCSLERSIAFIQLWLSFIIEFHIVFVSTFFTCYALLVLSISSWSLTKHWTGHPKLDFRDLKSCLLNFVWWDNFDFYFSYFVQLSFTQTVLLITITLGLWISLILQKLILLWRGQFTHINIHIHHIKLS